MVFHFVTGNNVVVHATQLRFRFLCLTRPSVLGFRAQHGFEDKHVFCGGVRKYASLVSAEGEMRRILIRCEKSLFGGQLLME